MPAWAIGLVTGVVTGVVTALGTYVVTRSRIRQELVAQYDSDLRRQRIEAYKILWAALKPLAQYGRDRPLPERHELEDVTTALRDWYFDTGGIYLSPSAREAYFRVQRTLRTLTESERWRSEGHESIDAETFRRLYAIASRLRTRLTLDVGTRRPFSLEQPSDLLPEDQRDPNERWITEKWGPGSEVA